MSAGIYRRRRRNKDFVWHVCVSICTFAYLGDAFSLPGVQMITYNKGDRLPLYVNSMTSSETLLPLDHYKLPFCQVRLIPFTLQISHRLSTSVAHQA